MANSKPRVIWQDGKLGYRIVRTGPKVFTFESMFSDAMSDESWQDADWIDRSGQTGCMDKLPEWILLSILEKLSRRRRRRKVSR